MPRFRASDYTDYSRIPGHAMRILLARILEEERRDDLLAQLGLARSIHPAALIIEHYMLIARKLQ